MASVEKKIETNESSLKLLAAIPMIRALERKKRMTGMSGRSIVSGAPMKKVIAVETRSMIAKYGIAFPTMIAAGRTGAARSASPALPTRSFITLIMKNWEVK
ncbi:hypothetical protein DSECCO2_644780 [anaerobic digester metagenome]